jgi:hypothetical protein
MQRYRWAHTRELVDLTCIAEFFLGGRGCCRLNEFSEARAGIGEAPGRKFNTKSFERVKHFFTPACVH